MTALFSLHGVVTCEEQGVWTQENLLLILAVPCGNARVSCTASRMRNDQYRVMLRRVYKWTDPIDSFIALISSIGDACGDEVTKRTQNS